MDKLLYNYKTKVIEEYNKTIEEKCVVLYDLCVRILSQTRMTSFIIRDVRYYVIEEEKLKVEEESK